MKAEKPVYIKKEELLNGNGMAYAFHRSPRESLIPVTRILDITALYTLNRRADRDNEPEKVPVEVSATPDKRSVSVAFDGMRLRADLSFFGRRIKKLELEVNNKVVSRGVADYGFITPFEREVGGSSGGRPVKVATIDAKNEEPMLYDGHIGVYSKNRVISIWFPSRLPGDPHYLSARVAVARAGREMLEAARRGGETVQRREMPK